MNKEKEDIVAGSTMQKINRSKNPNYTSVFAYIQNLNLIHICETSTKIKLL